LWWVFFFVVVVVSEEDDALGEPDGASAANTGPAIRTAPRRGTSFFNTVDLQI